MKKFVETILHIQEALGTILLSIFFIAITVQICARYLSVSLMWTEELANFSFIWAVFMGASVMVYRKAHFCFTYFKVRFKGKKGAAYDIFLSVIMLSFTIPMLFYGAILVREFWDYNWISLTWVKMGYTWLCLPIMGGTMSLYCLYHIIQDVHTLRDKGGE